MAGLHLHRSNRVEVLAAHLGALLADPLLDPLQPELIVVQSLGMRRWLSFRLAERFGIAMNCEFPFFADFAQRVFRSALGPQAGISEAFTREALLWRILAALPSALGENAFQPLRGYLSDDEATPLKSYQISRQIATVLDQYLAYIPERLLQWEAGQDDHWQARLWRGLVRAERGPHPAALLHRLQEQFAGESPALPELPERISIFGIASLPPFYLRLLAETCRATEVHLFLFEPTPHFWADLRSPAEQKRLLRRQGRRGQTAEDLHLEVGNELLASFGRAGRTFADAVLDLEPTKFHEGFRVPEEVTLLGRLQGDIYRLQEERETPPAPLDFHDGSVQIHCCHGPLREVEVLHDQLLALFERFPTLTPKDILVTMPNVETHAPFIEAIFGAPESDAVRIPYTVADRPSRAQNLVSRAFLQVLDLHGSRFPASALLELLETRAIRERFGIEEAELETLRAWVDRNAIRWGIDAAHRSAFGLPDFAQNSWRAGLDRLLLGYAWAGTGGGLFQDIVPDAEIEGSLAILLGQFAEFAEGLFELVPQVAEPRPPAAWGAFLAALVNRFFSASGDDSEEVVALLRAVGTLAGIEPEHPAPLPFAIVRAHLGSLLTQPESASGFIAGNLTFCSLKPMRSVPFRVVCLLGLNDGDFPRRDVPAAFDLLTEESVAAGRSRRDEDRQLFLESLLSARDVFYLSYSGLSTKDNSKGPPSVVVSELVDYLTELRPPGVPTEDFRESLLTRHRLQPFSSAYFGGEHRLFSYSLENSVAGALAGTSPESAPGPSGPCAGPPLPALEAGRLELDLRALSAFVCEPPKYFVERRLGARLPQAEDSVSDCEPIALDMLEQWQVARRLAEGLLAGQIMAQAAHRLRASGELPAGFFGSAQLEEIARDVRPLLERLEAAGLGAPRPPHAVTVAGETWQVQGTLDSLHAGGQRIFTAWTLKPKDRLRAWLKHLLLNAADEPGLPRVTLLFATDDTVRYQPCPAARQHLQALVELYRLGQTRPLPFFAKSSFDFARRSLTGAGRKDSDPALMARGVYEREEASDPYHDLCFRHLPTPCAQEWQELALRVWSPLLAP